MARQVMHSRLMQFAGGLLLTLTVSLLAVLALGPWEQPAAVVARPTSQPTFRPNTPDTVDHLVLIDTAEAFRGGKMKRVALRGGAPAAAQAAAIELDDPRERSWPRSGEWVS